MKKWNNPIIEELSVKDTEYAVSGGTRVDGTYNTTSYSYTEHTYGPSGANNGTPQFKENTPGRISGGIMEVN